jgi:hypothetical protein
LLIVTDSGQERIRGRDKFPQPPVAGQGGS